MGFKFALGTIVMLVTSKSDWLEEREYQRKLNEDAKRAFDVETERLIFEAAKKIRWERAGEDIPDSDAAAYEGRWQMLVPGEKIHFDVRLEQGEIRSRGEYMHGQNQYLVRYKAGDGRQTEAWFEEDAIFDPEQEAAPEQAGDGGPNPDYVAPEHRV